MDKQRQQHDAKLISIKEEEKLKMDKVALELELKWTETLRYTVLQVIHNTFKTNFNECFVMTVCFFKGHFN